MDDEELNSIQKAFLYVLGNLQDLMLNGYVASTDNAPYLLPKGMREYRQLIDSGYEATTEEIAYAVALFKCDPPEEDGPARAQPADNDPGECGS